MRGFHFFAHPALSVIAILALSTCALAGQPQTSIRMSFGVWDVPGNDVGISVSHTDLGNNERFTNVKVSGLSGSMAFSRMVSPRFAWELSMGGYSDSETQIFSEKINTRFGGNHYKTITSFTHSVSVSYVTFGVIYYPMYELKDTLGDISSFFRPYLTAGIGPYFGWEVRWDGNDLTDADFASTMGAYPGIGLDLLLSKHFIFNIDLRYQLVEFNEPLKEIKDFSGLNAVAGFKVAF